VHFTSCFFAVLFCGEGALPSAARRHRRWFLPHSADKPLRSGVRRSGAGGGKQDLETGYIA